MKEWAQSCLAPNIQHNCLLLLDAWSGHKDDDIFQGLNCIKMDIPPKTTSLVQPLDRYFFRQYKIVRKKISERIMLDSMPIDLGMRDNIIKMHALIHNQLCSPRFKPMIRFAWKDCGYDDQPKEHFQNLNDIYFRSQNPDCGVTDCVESAFIRCSHCSLTLCFNHFFVQCHTHFWL